MPETPCPVCGAVLAPRAVTGRPAVYCSTDCRRAREVALRRLRRRVARLEAERADIVARGRAWERRKPGIWAERIAATESEIARLF